MDEFKGNSNINKKTIDSPIIKKNITPVTNQVTVKKETEAKKFVKRFISEDASNIKSDVFASVIVPGVQRLISDLVRNTVDGIIYGRRGISPNNNGSRNISYSSYYDKYKYGSTGAPLIPSGAYTKSNIYSVNDVSFLDRGEAEEVLYRLNEAIERYHIVSVADFYDMISQKSSYTDQKYGWRDLRDAEIVRSRDGYSIKFPKIVPID